VPALLVITGDRAHVQVRQQFPQIAQRVTAVVLAGVIVFEIVGPILARTALIRAGEVPAGDDGRPATSAA
jgi:hypothetical protein